MKKARVKNPFDELALDPSIEIARFASFDHPTRRFIAHVLSETWLAHEDEAFTHGGNRPAPFAVTEAERGEREAIYARLDAIRDCTAKGKTGQSQRRAHFGDLLAMAKVDLRWRRLTTQAAFIYCYERLAGPQWRQLLIPCWIEAVHQRKKKGPTQLPLDRRLVSDRTIPRSLENDPPPRFYPTMADADAFDAPLLGLL